VTAEDALYLIRYGWAYLQHRIFFIVHPADDIVVSILDGMREDLRNRLEKGVRYLDDC
jgi:hypothetical protein